METPFFDIARNLKFNRFTIDVLMHRLSQLRPPRHRTAEECKRFVELMGDGVAASDRLQNRLRERLYGIHPIDVRAAAYLRTDLQDLNRNIAETIARLNSFEDENVRSPRPMAARAVFGSIGPKYVAKRLKSALQLELQMA